MKNILIILWVFIIVFLLSSINNPQTKENPVAAHQSQSQEPVKSEQVIYVIKGKKDPRLQATFLASYVSTSKSEECSYHNLTTATRKVRVDSKKFPVTEENYQIEIPIYLEENENQCGYRFSRIELVIRRLYDNDLYTRHILLSQKPEGQAIYRGNRSGHGGQSSLTMPSRLLTEKRYFRIAKQTQYVCRTRFYKRRNGDRLYCLMRIRDGLGRNEFIPVNEQQTVVTHSEFGVDEIKREVLQVDILADDISSEIVTGTEVLPDYFRTLPKPEPSRWEKIKNYIYKLIE